MSGATVIFGNGAVAIVSDEPFIPILAVEAAAIIVHGTRAALNDLNIRSSPTLPMKAITPAMLAVSMASKMPMYPRRATGAMILGILNKPVEYRCIVCKDCIPPGRPGRKCQKCRKHNSFR